MLWLYRFISGYLTVVITSVNAERLINAAAENSIFFFGMRYRKHGVEAKILISHYRRLRTAARGTGARVHIKSKHGLPFWVYRYRHRWGLSVGAVIFFAVLYLLSMFIWSVEVTGNKTVDKTKIIAACESIGVGEGTLKVKINSTVDAQRMLLKLPQLAWGSLNIEGSVLTVNVSEAQNDNSNSKEPNNLIASADGIIKKLDVTGGNALVSVGDVVKKGDLLVSGITESMNYTEFVTSQGIVIAETVHTFTLEENFDQEREVPIGKIKSHSVLTFFGIDIPLYLGEIKGNFISEKSTKVFSIFGKNLPISLTTKKCTFVEKKTVNSDRNALIIQLRDVLKKKLTELSINEYTVTDEKVTESEKGISITFSVTAVENIAVSEKILLGKSE